MEKKKKKKEIGGNGIGLNNRNYPFFFCPSETKVQSSSSS